MQNKFFSKLKMPRLKVQRRARLPRAPKPKAAEVLEEFLANSTGDTVTLGDLMAALGGRAFGVAIFVFAVANLLIANLPGMSTILGIPVVLIAAQIMLGLERPWLPQALAQKQIKRTTLAKMTREMTRVLRKLERFIKPRWLVLSEKRAERILGAYCFLIGLVLTLPIVFGNWLPSWALAFMALGLIEKDGVFISIGMAIGLLAISYAVAFYTGFVYLFDWLVR